MADPFSIAVNAAIVGLNMALQASQQIEGPRLDSLDVTGASYGTAFIYTYGTRRLEGCPVIFAEPLTEVKRRRKTKGGKYNEYTYYGTWAVLVCDHPADAVTRIWFDKHLIYDASGAGPISPFGNEIASKIRIYLGEADQEPDPRMAATVDAAQGEGSTPAYRGVTYLMFEDIPLEKLGNRLPQVSVEVVTNGGDTFPFEQFSTVVEAPFGGAIGFAPDGSRFMWAWEEQYEIWDLNARARMISGAFADGAHLQETVGIANNGDIYILAEGKTTLFRYGADGTGPATPIPLDYSSGRCQVFQLGTDGTGAEVACMTGNTPLLGTAIQMWPLDGPVLTVLNVDWFPSAYCKDGYGSIWSVGAEDGGTTLYMQRILASAEDPLGNGYIEISGLPSTSAYFVFAFSSNGKFVVSWAQSHLYLIDQETGALEVSRAYSGEWLREFACVKPGASSIWLGYSEISASDLSTLRTVSEASWGGASTGAGRLIYDETNHAIIGAPVFSYTLVWRYLDRVAGAGVTLQTIVQDVADRCGLDPDDYDFSAFSQTVRGYSWTQGTPKAILEPLLEAFDVEVRPHDFTLQGLVRGGALGAAIAVNRMGAGGAKRYTATRTLDTDLPRAVDVTFADVAMDQQPNTAHAQRPGAATNSARTLSLDLSTLVLSADEARRMAEGYLRRKWYGAERYELSLTRGYTGLEPGDLRTLTLDDISRPAKLEALEFGANGVLSCKWVRDAPAVHVVSTLTGGSGDGFRDSAITAVGYSKGFLLDVPLAVDADEGLILYAAAGPYSDAVSWPGCVVYRSDDGIDYGEEFVTVPSARAAIWGYASGALPDALPTVWDRASTLTVVMQSGELSSATEAEVLNGANQAVLGDELIQFATATLVGTNTYELSTLLRGRRGTEQHTAGHAAGDRFILLSARVAETMGASDVGDLIYFKPVTQGAQETSGFPQSLTYTGASKKPYSPAHLTVEDEAGDLVANWVRRTRIGGAWQDFNDAALGEGSEAYVGQVLNGGGTVIRTFSGLTSPTLTYTAAQQASDGGAGATLRVMQVSTTVGNGFPADIAI